MLTQRLTVREIPKLRKSAKGEQCTMYSPMCNGNSETVVWCHSDYSEHGRGFSHKSHDVFGFYGCSGCNAWYDVHSKEIGSKFYVEPDERRRYYQKAHDKSLIIVIEKGVLR